MICGTNLLFLLLLLRCDTLTGRNWLPGEGPRRVSTAELLQQCGWMSVHQLGVYTSGVEVHKILQSKQPKYLYEKLTASSRMQVPHRTRQHFQFVNSDLVESGKLQVPRARLEVTNTSWRWRAAGQYDKLPYTMKQLNVAKFKDQLKSWVKNNV